MALSLPETIRILLPGGAVKKMPLEEYVRGVAAAALPPDAPLEALKAQAVAARTFGAITRRHIERGADVCTLRHCQVWKAAHTALAVRAAEETRGIVAVHNGRLIDAYYFDHCDGNTRDATGILMQPPPYLRGVACPCGFATLKGHGIGMCQRGALVRARFGDTFDVILKHYYSEITLERAGVMPIAPSPSPVPSPGRKPHAVSTVKASAESAPDQKPRLTDDASRGEGPRGLEVEPPPVAPTPIQAREPEKPKRATRTKKQAKTRPRRAKKTSATSPPALASSPPLHSEPPSPSQSEGDLRPGSGTNALQPEEAIKAKSDTSVEPPVIIPETATTEQDAATHGVPASSVGQVAPLTTPADETSLAQPKPIVEVPTESASAVAAPTVEPPEAPQVPFVPVSGQVAAVVAAPGAKVSLVPVAKEAAPVVEPPESLQAPSVPVSTEGIEDTTTRVVEPIANVTGGVGWYPIAGEFAFETDRIEVGMRDEELEESAQVTVTIEAQPGAVLPQALPPPEVGASAPPAPELAAAAPVEEPVKLPPAPESMPEELPVFPVVSLPERIPTPAPPPPLVEEELDRTLSAAPPPPPPLLEEEPGGPLGAGKLSEVLIDHLPGPRMIAGDLLKPGIIIAIRDTDGHAVVTVSGAAPHYGAGGFEAPLGSDGTYAVTFNHHALEVNLKNETVFIAFSG